MPARLRQPVEPTDDWLQLRLLTSSAEQLTYELIRPVVLFGQSPSERAHVWAHPGTGPGAVWRAETCARTQGHAF